MRRYSNKPIATLASELRAGLLRLRRRFVDAAEALIQIIDPQQDYPYDFVVYRVTGYRPTTPEDGQELLRGRSLVGDLQSLILDVCDSFDLRPEDYAAQKTYDSAGLARHLGVSGKTIQRWRRQGLVARRMALPDGTRRLAFLESSVEWFVQQRGRHIGRAVRFTKMTPAERTDLLRRARRMASFTRCTLNQVARRLAARTGRAAETIRYTIRRFDLEHPDQAIFPSMSAPLDERQKEDVYRSFLNGMSVSQLARRHRRTRGSIYRILNEVRARQLLGQPIRYVYNPQFELPSADELILSPEPPPAAASPAAKPSRRAADDLPPYLRALYDTPLLDGPAERALFARFNYLKHKADQLRKQIDLDHVRTGDLKRIESLLLQANMVKNHIIRANLRLVVSIAKKHVGGAQNLFELISDGNVSLMRAVEKFDFSRGNRFSTYASWAIMRNFARSVPRERYRLDRFATGQTDALDIAASLQYYDPNEANLPELRESIDVVLARLTPLERTVLIDHYGLDDQGQTKTLDQLGRHLGVSKERVRQIELRALKKLRKLLHPQQADLLG
jgi:RNA polymerase sigma factor (sigma-70 family)